MEFFSSFKVPRKKTFGHENFVNKVNDWFAQIMRSLVEKCLAILTTILCDFLLSSMTIRLDIWELKNDSTNINL